MTPDEISDYWYDQRYADAAFADVLARSAALPSLDTDGMSLDEAARAAIRQVVAASPLRLELPADFDPDACPEDSVTGYPDHFIVNGDHCGCPCGGADPQGGETQ